MGLELNDSSGRQFSTQDLCELYFSLVVNASEAPRILRSRDVKTANQAPSAATGSAVSTWPKKPQIFEAGHHISVAQVTRANGIMPTAGRRSVWAQYARSGTRAWRRTYNGPTKSDTMRHGRAMPQATPTIPR